MKLNTGWIGYDVDGQKVTGYFARPTAARGPLPGVVLIQEVWGVDPHIQDVADRLATAGYAVLAPELFSYGGKPAPLSPERIEDAKQFLDTLPVPAWFDPAQRAPAIAALPDGRRQAMDETLGLLLNRNRPWDPYFATVRGAKAWLQAEHAQGQKVGAVGFCLGGALSLQFACKDPELAAAVVFYGFAPPHELLDGLRAPVLGLYAEAAKDPNIGNAVPALAEAMKQKGKRFEHRFYSGANHAFFNDSRAASYHVGAARDAWARTLGFFAAHLAG